MTQKSTNAAVFENGKLKPGIYKIQNLVSDTYIDTNTDTPKLCCRPAQDLEEGRGLWEIKSFGAGYTLKRVGPGRLARYCSTIEGVVCGSALAVSHYPVAWRIESMESIHGKEEYVRFYWGPKTALTWDLSLGSKENGTPVQIWNDAPALSETWRLILVKEERDEGMFTPPQSPSAMTIPGSLPHEQDKGSATAAPDEGKQHSTTCSHKLVETTDDGFGTTITEVTVEATTTTVTTRKKYRVGVE